MSEQAATVGNPESIGAKTRLVVHYKPSSASDNRGVYVWGTDVNGGNMDAKHHAFTGTDCWGKVAVLNFDGKYDKFGFLVTTSDWNKYGADRSATVSADGTAEVWIDGTKYPDQGEATTVETLDSAPADYACKANTVKVKVHYNRDDGLYYNAEDTSTTVPQWDIWTWSSNWNGGAATFTTHDDWGEIAEYSFTNYTYYNNDGASDIGMLRRYGKDAWKAKDPDDADHRIPSNALVFDADGNASAEVWLLGGDATVYTSRPSLGATMKSAEISGTNQLSAKLSKKVSTDDLKGKVTVTDADGKAVDVKSLKADGTKVIITADKDLDVRGKYTVEIKGFGSQNAIAGSVVRTDAFDRKYAYSGEDLARLSPRSRPASRCGRRPPPRSSSSPTSPPTRMRDRSDHRHDKRKQGRVERHGEEACLRHRVLLQAHLRRRHGEHLRRSVRHRGRRQRRALRSALQEGHGQGGQAHAASARPPTPPSPR